MARAINSKILQEDFAEDYRQFASENELIVSTSPAFMLTGEYSAFYGGISICQKVPLKVYAGLRPISDKKIVVEEIYQTYVRPQDKFFSLSFWSEEIKKINNFLNIHFETLIEKKGGCRISFLSETSEEEDLNLLATSSALIALLFYLYYNSIKENEIVGWQKLKSTQLKEDKAFQKIFRLAWKINQVARDGLSSGTNVFMAMVNSGKFPAIYCTERDNRQSENPSYFGESMADILGDASLDWHFDLGLIQFGGWRSIAAAGAHLIKRNETNLEQIKEDNYIKSLPIKEPGSLFAHSKKENFWLIFMEALDLISLRLLLGLKNVFQFGPSHQNFSLFLEALNQHWAFFKILGLDAPEFNVLLQILQKQVKKDDQVGAKVRAYGLGQKGCMIFAVPRNSLIDKEEILEKEFKTRLGPDVYFSYLSWLDGTRIEGVKVEQDLKNKIYSTFVDREEIRVREYDYSFQPTHRFISRSELNKQKENIDLILDYPGNRIYLGSKRLTSQEIRSARETIKVLDQLLNYEGELKNSDFTPSCYSANQYELSGKIIIPLKRAVKNILGKELYLTVQGKIYDFSVHLDLANLKVWVIERLSA